MREEQITALVQDMTLAEKIGQMVQLEGNFFYKEQQGVVTGPASEEEIADEVKAVTGSVLNVYGAEKLIAIQREFMKKQPHHIPLLFMFDVIHGFKTIFPAPLGLGAAFEPELAKECAGVAAKEASASGLHVVFSPMVDLVRDARWGRVVESTGEDPYLNGLYAAAQVEGFQGENPGEEGKICACIKHFAGYGAPVAGRDYNTVELSERTFREYYLAAYQKGIAAGTGMVMTSFNTVNGIPASVNRRLMQDILRNEMGFDGVLISDYEAIRETISHGYSENEEKAAQNAVTAGVDIDMMSYCYSNNLMKLVKTGKIREEQIDECVLRILRLKNKLGLFEKPYKDADPEQERKLHLCEDHRKLARTAAEKSFVLLKNDKILPLDTAKKIAFIGPYTEEKHMLSSWALSGDYRDTVTIREAAEKMMPDSELYFCNGSPILTPGYRLPGFEKNAPESQRCWSQEEAKELLDKAVQLAKQADTIIMPLGEHFLQSGEAASRSELDIPEVQMELFREVVRVNPNVIVLVFSGRPLDLREVSEKAKAVLEVWFPGSEGGAAIMNVLTGAVNPSGKLPMSFPYSIGQVPVYYNEYSTGRPYYTNSKERFQSRYIDIPNEPLYPFGYGLSYTKFQISPVHLDKKTITGDETLCASVTIENTGDYAGTETLQLYIRDLYASVVRPVKELKGFRKVYLSPGEKQVVTFTITEKMLHFLRADGTWGSEPGTFHVWIGNSSACGEGSEFVLY